jgi:hypothetical protein
VESGKVIRSEITEENAMRVFTVGSLLGLCFLSAGLAQAEEIIPSAEQTTVLRGTAEVKDGIRAVTGKIDATGHGPIT